jgi:hypothetical protein
MYVREKGGGKDSPGSLSQAGFVMQFFIKYRTEFKRFYTLSLSDSVSSSIIVSEVFITVFSALCSLFQLVMVTIQYNLCCSYFEASFNPQFFLCFAVSKIRPAL